MKTGKRRRRGVSKKGREVKSNEVQETREKAQKKKHDFGGNN